MLNVNSNVILINLPVSYLVYHFTLSHIHTHFDSHKYNYNNQLGYFDE